MAKSSHYLNILPYGIWNVLYVVVTSLSTDLNILPYGIWNITSICLITSSSYLNILPYGIWNSIILALCWNALLFEHSSLWDLKQYGFIGSWWCVSNLNILPYGIWNIFLKMALYTHLADIWTFFPMGFETYWLCSCFLFFYIWTFFPMGFETCFLCENKI